MLFSRPELEQQLERFAPAYNTHFRSRMMRRLGFFTQSTETSDQELVASAELADPVLVTLQLLAVWPVAYGSFFAALERRIATGGLPAEAEALAPFVVGAPEPPRQAWLTWRDCWWAWSRSWPAPVSIAPTLARWNLPVTPVRSEIERIWEAIDQRDDWSPLEDWLKGTRVPVGQSLAGG